MRLVDGLKALCFTSALLLVGCDDDDGDDGTASLSGVGPGTGGDDRTSRILALDGDVSAGADVFASNLCSTAPCHGEDGLSGTAPSLADQVPAASDMQIVSSLLGGKGDMPPQDALSDQELADVLAWLNATF